MKPTFEQLQPGMQLKVKKIERHWTLIKAPIRIGEILTVVEKSRSSKTVTVSKSSGNVMELFWLDLRNNTDLVDADKYTFEAKKPLEVGDIRLEGDRIHFIGDGNEFSIGFGKAKSYSFCDECSISVEFNVRNKSGKKKVTTKMLNILKKNQIFVDYLIEKINAAVDEEHPKLDMTSLSQTRNPRRGNPMDVWFNGTLEFKNCIYEPCSIEKTKLDFECLVDTFCENRVSFTHTSKLEDKLAR